MHPFWTVALYVILTLIALAAVFYAFLHNRGMKAKQEALPIRSATK